MYSVRGGSCGQNVKTKKAYCNYPPTTRVAPLLCPASDVYLPGRHWSSRRELGPLCTRGEGVGCLRSTSRDVAEAGVLSSRHGDPHRRHLLRRQHGVVVWTRQGRGCAPKGLCTSVEGRVCCGYRRLLAPYSFLGGLCFNGTSPLRPAHAFAFSSHIGVQHPRSSPTFIGFSYSRDRKKRQLVR